MPIEEDSDEKIRRNLVVASALIIAVAWLQLPMTEIAYGFLKVEKGALQPSPLKTWVAALACLLYLYLRYRFSLEWSKLDKAVHAPASQMSKDYVQAFAQRKLEEYNRTSVQHGVLVGDLKEIVETWVSTQKKEGKAPPDETVRAELYVHTLQHTLDQWSGSFTLAVRWLGYPQGAITEAGAVRYRVEGWLKLLIALRSYVLALFYSRGSVQYLVPKVLAAVAFAIVFCNIWRNAFV